MTRRVRLTLRLSAGCGILLVAVACIWLAYNHRYTKIANSVLTAARSDANSIRTPDEAAAWLGRHEFQVLDAGGRPVGYRGPAGPEQLHIVRGVRRLGPRWLGFGSRWMAIEFQFSANGELREILLDDDTSPPPWARRTASGQDRLN